MNLYDKASLIITPNAYKAGKIYAAKPTDGTGDLTVTRATTAMRRNASGVWESVAVNVPRLNYPVGGGCPSWLDEPQATNLDTNSATFAAWVLNNSGGVTVANVVASNPFNNANVVKVIPDAVSGQHRAFNIFNYSSTGVIWGIFKADGYNFMSFGEAGGIGGGNTIFDLSNGTISTTGSATAPFIISQGNGWYLCGITMANTGSASRWIIVRNANNTSDYIGDGTSGILCAHKQLEIGSVATSPIITAGSAVTRNADALILNSASALIGQTEGTIFIEVQLQGQSFSDGVVRLLLSISDGTGSNRIEIYRYNNQIHYDLVAGGAVWSSGSPIFTITDFTGQPIKLALSYTLNNVKVFINGALVNTDTTALIPACNRLAIGCNRDGFSQWNGLIRTVLLGPLFTDAECIALTTI